MCCCITFTITALKWEEMKWKQKEQYFEPTPGHFGVFVVKLHPLLDDTADTGCRIVDKLEAGDVCPSFPQVCQVNVQETLDKKDRPWGERRDITGKEIPACWECPVCILFMLLSFSFSWMILTVDHFMFWDFKRKFRTCSFCTPDKSCASLMHCIWNFIHVHNDTEGNQRLNHVCSWKYQFNSNQWFSSVGEVGGGSYRDLTIHKESADMLTVKMHRWQTVQLSKSVAPLKVFSSLWCLETNQWLPFKIHSLLFL